MLEARKPTVRGGVTLDNEQSIDVNGALKSSFVTETVVNTLSLNTIEGYE